MVERLGRENKGLRYYGTAFAPHATRSPLPFLIAEVVLRRPGPGAL